MKAIIIAVLFIGGALIVNDAQEASVRAVGSEGMSISGGQLYQTRSVLTPQGLVEVQRQAIPQTSAVCYSGMGITRSGRLVTQSNGLGTLGLDNTNVPDGGC